MHITQGESFISLGHLHLGKGISVYISRIKLIRDTTTMVWIFNISPQGRI